MRNGVNALQNGRQAVGRCQPRREDGELIPMISCVAWPHRDLAAGSCPNLPPAFCPSSGLFTHSGQQGTLHPRLSHTVPQTKLSERCTWSCQKPLSREWCRSALEMYTDQRVLKESTALAAINSDEGSMHFPAAGSCQPQTTRWQVNSYKIHATSPSLTF